MIIRLTQRLAAKIKESPAVALHREFDPFADWTANLFTAERTQYILFTNSASLYSVVFAGRGITRSDLFVERAVDTLREVMVESGYGAIFEKRIEPLTSDIVFSKTGDRRVMGSMNDHVHCARVHFEYGDQPSAVAARLNKTPMGFLAYRFPKEVLAELGGLEKGPSKGGKLIPFPVRK